MSSHKCPKHDAHDFRNKHPFWVIGTQSEFSEPIDEGFYEFDLFHFCRPIKFWFIFASQMKLRVVPGSQKLGPHYTDQRLAPPITRSASPNTKWVYWVPLFKPNSMYALRLPIRPVIEAAQTMVNESNIRRILPLMGFDHFDFVSPVNHSGGIAVLSNNGNI
ncbi:hypothetical protein Cgig2_033920 [Carnegiea gigantea]|uniref:Uncharacterized protein n=1 Tax=Carnegiea gigantea TaxID=171969 RepID=A0A9Q1JS20_9CARY|nr:hypothetical protein Cgig2_033920 [Carnegiea gigantea]